MTEPPVDIHMLLRTLVEQQMALLTAHTESLHLQRVLIERVLDSAAAQLPLSTVAAAAPVVEPNPRLESESGAPVPSAQAASPDEPPRELGEPTPAPVVASNTELLETADPAPVATPGNERPISAPRSSSGAPMRSDRYYQSARPVQRAPAPPVTLAGLDVLRCIQAAGEVAHLVLTFGPHAGESLGQVGSVGTRDTVQAPRAAGVKLWQILGTGLDHVDMAFILDSGLAVANTPGPFSSVALAEHALLLMLYFAKQFPLLQQNVRGGTFYRPITDELEGSTLGLVGLGASGRELANRACAFGMRIVGLDLVAPRPELPGVQYLGGPEALDQLLVQSDYVSLHVPLTRRTRHLLDARALACMRPDSVLINVARGGIVDEAALVGALRGRRLRGAGLDVFAHEPLESGHPFFELENVVLTPYVAGGTRGTSRRRAEAVAERSYMGSALSWSPQRDSGVQSPEAFPISRRLGHIGHETGVV